MAIARHFRFGDWLGIKDMKTQEQWATRVQNSKEPWAKLVAEIQADALQHAADTCQKHANAYKNSSEGFGGGWTVLASEECRDLILTERAALMPNAALSHADEA